jgi:hypothetical protein
MSTKETKVVRRALLRTMLAGGALAASAALARPTRAQEKASLLAKRVDKVPQTVDDPVWQGADALNVPLAPQVVVKPRTFEIGIKAILVRALYDAERIAFRLEWQDARSDTDIGAVAASRDAVALQFPANPADGIPFFGMGEPNKPVTIYQWKADWLFGRDRDVSRTFPNMAADAYPFSGRGPGEIPELGDYGKGDGDKTFHTSWWAGNSLGDPEAQARTPVEKLAAAGFGSVTPAGADRQDALGHGAWKDGAWRALISIPRGQDSFAFAPRMTVPFAFAAWDGAKGERGGQKGVSTWYFVSLERPVGSVLYWGPALALVGAAAAQALGLRYLRRKARAKKERGD